MPGLEIVTDPYDAVAGAGVPLPAASLAESFFRAASAQGLGRNGTQAIFEFYKRLRGQA